MNDQAADGVLVVDKPVGPSSHDVVARVRRALRTRRVGHTGTLDPLASGVLPLVVNRATRLARFFAAGEKTYDAEIRLGRSSPTYDAAGLPPGSPASESPPNGLPEAAAIEAALSAFQGTFAQRPPPFSAKKIDGIRAYRLARRQEPMPELRPVAVTVHELQILALDGDRVSVRLTVSAGFYVRSLAHDLGERLGCGAYLSGLRRLRSGEFTLADALPLDVVETDPLGAAGRLLPLERLLPSMPAATLTGPGRRKASQGRSLTAADVQGTWPATTPEAPWARLVDEEGALVAIATAGEALRPVVVLV